MADVSYPPLDISGLSIPSPANAAPMAEKTGAAIGAQVARYALEDHQHPRQSSSTVGTVTIGNTADIVFTRSFTAEPAIDYCELPPTATTTSPIAADLAATAQPTTCKVISWAMSGANYVGCTIRVFKAQTIPQNLVSVLLGGVFNLFGASVVGTRFSIIALVRSDT